MKKRLIIPLALLAVLGAAYIGLWRYSAIWFEREIVNLSARAQEQGVTLLGPPPVLQNFPFVPEVVYTAGINTNGTDILFPRVIVRGYPVPFTSLTLSFPEGLRLGGPVDPSIWSLDTAMAKLVIPAHLPRNLSQEEIAAWHANGGKIGVRHFKLTRGTLHMEGEGDLSLDDALQPDLSAQATLRGYEAFLQEQMAEGRIEIFPGTMAIAVFNGLAVENEETKEREVTLDIIVKNRLLSAGPLQALPLPAIVWDRHTPPDLRR